MRRLLLLLLLVACDREESSELLSPGRGAIAYNSVILHYFIPDAPRDAMPLLFLFPGIERDAANYLDAWIDAATTDGRAVIAFEFPRAAYTNNEYITGNVIDASGQLVPRDQRSFAVIESAFDYLKGVTGSRVARYDMFGHSAGAQFVHRYLLFNPGARVRRAVAANAGWYTVPDFSIDFPHGIKDVGLSEDDLRAAFSIPLTVHLGTSDTRQDASLNTSPGSMLQGPHRYARGLYFYNACSTIALRASIPFALEKRELPNVGHDQAKMARDAALIFRAD